MHDLSVKLISSLPLVVPAELNTDVYEPTINSAGIPTSQLARAYLHFELIERTLSFAQLMQDIIILYCLQSKL